MFIIGIIFIVLLLVWHVTRIDAIMGLLIMALGIGCLFAAPPVSWIGTVIFVPVGFKMLKG